MACFYLVLVLILSPIFGNLEGACVIDAIHDLEEMEGVVPSDGEIKLPQVSSPAVAAFFLFLSTARTPRVRLSSAHQVVTEVSCNTGKTLFLEFVRCGLRPVIRFT